MSRRCRTLSRVVRAEATGSLSGRAESARLGVGQSTNVYRRALFNANMRDLPNARMSGGALSKQPSPPFS